MPLRTSIGITFILTIWLLVSLPSPRLAKVINTLRNFCSVLKPLLTGYRYYIVEIELILPLQKLHSLYEKLYGRKLAEFQRCQSSLPLRSPETYWWTASTLPFKLWKKIPNKWLKPSKGARELSVTKWLNVSRKSNSINLPFNFVCFILFNNFYWYLYSIFWA